ncbi:MAG: DNA alkylation repair protein, partial [Bacteroidota bacterium]
MTIISRKPIVRAEVEASLETYQSGGISSLLQELDERLLQVKVRFPLLEYATELLYKSLNDEVQIPFLDRISVLKREGGNVILGKMLQLRLNEHYEESLSKAAEYIAEGKAWFVSDLIGERLFGVALLSFPEKSLKELDKLKQHPSHWVLRALGAGSHYAVKKGLEKDWVEKLFQFLLSMATHKDREVRRGIGWAAKTTARFHPEIIERYEAK